MYKVILLAVCGIAIQLAVSQQCEIPESQRSCQATCEFMTPPCDKEEGPQDLCQCEQGYIPLNYLNTTCVPMQQCLNEGKCSKPNLKWNYCGSSCRKTCANPNPEACIKRCEMGCFCEEGLILNEANMECIKPEECPH